MVLAVLLLSKDLGTEIRLVRDISSIVSCILAKRELECASDGIGGASLFDWSLENKPAFLVLGVEIVGAVREWTRVRLSKDWAEGEGVGRGKLYENVDIAGETRGSLDSGGWSMMLV